MKLIFLVLFICSSVNGFLIDQRLVDQASAIFARAVAETVLNTLVTEIESGKHSEFVQTLSRRQPAPQPLNITLTIPPLADPIYYRPAEDVAVNISLGALFSLKGEYSICAPQLKGLSGFGGMLNILYELDTGLMTLNLALKPVTTLLESIIKSNLELAILNSPMQISGEGNFSSGASDFFLTFHGKGKVPILFEGKMSLDELAVDLGFTGLTLSAENSAINGAPVELQGIADTLTSLFPIIWTEPLRTVINEVIRCLIDHSINGCTFGELLTNATGCLNPLDLTCLPAAPEPPVNFFSFFKHDSTKQEGFCAPYPQITTTTTQRSTTSPNPISESTSTNPESTTAGVSTISIISQVTLALACFGVLSYSN